MTTTQSGYGNNTSQAAQRKFIALLLLLLAGMVLIESIARVVHDRRMATLRVESGVRKALLIRHSPESRQLLFAGNSLVYDDLSEAALQQSLSPGFVVHAAGVPGSTYDDWQVGLRALFDRGSQPDGVVFSISPSQFLRAHATTPVPVALLWSTHDIFAYQREQRLGATQLTELLLEHYSTFYSLRNTVRIYVRRFIPGYEAMIYGWGAPQATPIPQSAQAAEIAYEQRLARLATDCGPHSQLILLLPPTNQIDDERLEPLFKAAAANLGIAVVEPIAERQWPLSKFREDQYHLSVDAAVEFSRLVAVDVQRKLVLPTNRASLQ